MGEERAKAVKCLRELRNYLTDDTDLKSPIHDERFLIRFVRAKKYDATVAHNTVRTYFRVRQKNPNIFKIAVPSHDAIKEILEKKVITLLKQKDPFGRPVIVCNPWETEKYNLDQIIAAYVLIGEELLLMTLESQINGIVTLMDGNSFGLQHAKQYTLKRMKTMIAMGQGNFPARNKGIHIVNEPSFVDTMISIVRPFMTEKTKQRIMFHGTKYENLHEVVPAEILPESYGGKLTDSEAYDETFIKSLILRDHYYQELLGYGFGNWESDDEDTYM